MSRVKRDWRAKLRQVRTLFENRSEASGYVVGMELRLDRDPERSVWVSMTVHEARALARKLNASADIVETENQEAGYLI